MMELNALGLLDDADIDLVEAGITLALADRPAADPARLRRLVSGWAIALQRDTAPVSGSGRARLLSGLIASETGLTGATEDYDNPLNADLIALVERGRGLPVALSILYVALARRVGWRADALNLPGHVIVEVCGGVEPALIDPFDHGTGITRERAVEIARHGGGDAAPVRFDPMTNRQLLIRLITNQASRARNAGDAPDGRSAPDTSAQVPSSSNPGTVRPTLANTSHSGHRMPASEGVTARCSRKPAHACGQRRKIPPTASAKTVATTNGRATGQAPFSRRANTASHHTAAAYIAPMCRLVSAVAARRTAAGRRHARIQQ